MRYSQFVRPFPRQTSREKGRVFSAVAGLARTADRSFCKDGGFDMAVKQAEDKNASVASEKQKALVLRWLRLKSSSARVRSCVLVSTPP